MPTALFAVWLLGQYLTPMQWASLPVLAVGVVLVTMNGSAGKARPSLHQAQPDALQASASTAYAEVLRLYSCMRYSEDTVKAIKQ